MLPVAQWKHSHNYMHHQWTNVVGMDNDIGYGILRDRRASSRGTPEPRPAGLLRRCSPSLFEYGVALHDLEVDSSAGEKVPKDIKPKLCENVAQKIRARSPRTTWCSRPWRPPGVPSACSTANAAANVIRNLWSFAVIFCGHFPDGVEIFPEEELENETRGQWYRRQILGSANFEGGRAHDLMTGNLDHQIEHHLFPDLPSNRYPEIAVKVRALCDKYDIPYTIGPLHKQYGQALRTIIKLSVPNSWTSSDQPEPPSPVRDRRRRSDAERPSRRPELGAWSRSRSQA